MEEKFVNEYDYRDIDKIKHKTHNERITIKNILYKHDGCDDNKRQRRNCVKKINKSNV